MKRTICWVLAGLLAPSILSSMTYYVLRLRGGSQFFASDAPVRKGRLTLFHRYPDGVYMSVSSSEVVKVETGEETPRPGRFEPGDTVYIGGTLAGPRHPMPEATTPDSTVYAEPGLGDGYLYGYGGYVPPPRPVPPPAPPSRIGPNGFPILAPPGAPGSAPLSIGPNGFPILSSPPPAVSPVRP